MKFGRLSFEEEKLLWHIARDHFGLDGLQEVLHDLWSSAPAPTRALVENLDAGTVGQDVLEILQRAQVAAGAKVPGRAHEPNRIALYSRHARHLTGGLINQLPATKLPRAFRGVKIQDELGV
jgi:hypothetical protein